MLFRLLHEYREQPMREQVQLYRHLKKNNEYYQIIPIICIDLSIAVRHCPIEINQ